MKSLSILNCSNKFLLPSKKSAHECTQKILSKPFTVHTAYASAMGRSSKGRIYAFITTSDGHDLATLLVKKGYARAYGVGRKNFAGVSRDEISANLKDHELSAMLNESKKRIEVVKASLSLNLVNFCIYNWVFFA